MPVHHHDSVVDRNDPEILLDLLEALPEPVVVGFEPTRRHVDLHVAPLPVDDRCGSAGLFGMRARRGWSAVGVSFAGRVRDLERGEILAGGADAAVVVTRDGRHASRLHLDLDEPDDRVRLDERLDEQLDDRPPGAAPEGLVVDALHRILGLPSPGGPPHPALLALCIWTHEILRTVLLDGTISWERALRLHPGEPGAGAVDGSDEVLVEATIRSADGFRWEHVHARAVGGSFPLEDLTPAEAAWMDTTLFARWVTTTMPDPRAVAEVLQECDCEAVAARLLAVHDGVRRLAARAGTR